MGINYYLMVSNQLLDDSSKLSRERKPDSNPTVFANLIK